MKSTRLLLSGTAFLFVACLFLVLGSPEAQANVMARYIRIDDPTGFAFEWRQVEVYSGGQNIILHHPEMFTGTVPPTRENTSPTPDNIVLKNPREAGELVNGDTDTKHRASEWRQYSVQGGANYLNPWIEIDLGKEYDVEKIVLYGSNYPGHFYLDKGHRVVSAMNEGRKVVWAEKFQYYDESTHGIFTFVPVAQTPRENPVVGTIVPERAPDWVSMAWLLNADAAAVPPDAAERMKHFADRNSPLEVERLAKRFFTEIDPRTPGMEMALKLYNAGQYGAALEAWKRYWFAKMWRINSHQALHSDYVSYGANGDDLLKGIMVTITPGEATAIHYTPGDIYWIQLPPKGAPGLNKAIDDCIRKSEVGMVSWPLLYAYRKRPDPKYMQRWSEIMDDWDLNFFPDAEKPPYEVENLFTYNPGQYWQTTMEDLSDISKEHPEMVNLIPATTLARMQLICLEKYTTGYWRQARETVFNHLTGGLYVYDGTLDYLQEFFPGERAKQEWQQAFERFLTMATERDGAITEIGDEGHMEIPTLLSTITSRAEVNKPAWYTLQWKNRFYEWYDNLFYYMFRHLSPGGYEHRYAVDYRPYRWTSTWKPYWIGRPTLAVNRDSVVFGVPEVRRMLDAWGHISSGVPTPGDPVYDPIVNAEKETHEQVKAFLGDEKPGPPHINSDWMPYTGAYYFRGSWDDYSPFLAMMACGSHGGSQAPQWEYSMIYQYDYNYPLVAALPIQVDGMQPQQLFGRMNCFQPGTKTMDLTYADEKPAQHRWLSDARYDFGEAEFHGGYQNYPGFHGNWDDGSLRENDPGKGVPNMHALRQIIQVRGAARLFIVTDAIESPDGASHKYTIPYKISLSTRREHPTKEFSSDQLQIDPKGLLSSDNPDGPSVSLYQFADQPIKYNRGPDTKADFEHYARRLSAGVGIADQPVDAEFDTPKMSMVSVISSRDKGAVDRIASIQSMNVAGAVGFHAKLQDGGEIWYETAPLGSASLTCGLASATAQGLLVQMGKEGLSGIVLGAKNMTVNGRSMTVRNPDFEFVMAHPGAPMQITDIYTPIDPISFLPNENTFADSEMVQMVSKTPNIEIHYTTDCSTPTLASPIYRGPIKITATTDFAARAWRLGPDGKPLPHEDFEINGTKFTVPSYGWFTKRPYNLPVAMAANELQPGLNYDYLNAPWWKLYAEAHWLPAAGGGTADREMDTSKVSTNDSYGMRYKGFIRIPQDGVYTFQAPHEMVYMDNAPSYDERLYIDGEEWYLTQWWHGHGTWSVPLKSGLHAFEVDFADARSKPWQRSGIWNFYPRPWAVFQDKPSDLLVTGPGINHARIPQQWFFRKPQPRTYPDERVLVDSANELNCTWNNTIDASLANVQEICFKTDGNPTQVFANLSFVKSDGTQLTYGDVTRDNSASGFGAGVYLNLHGQFDRVTGALALSPKQNVIILYHNPVDEKNPATQVDPAFPRGGVTTTAAEGKDTMASR